MTPGGALRQHRPPGDPSTDFEKRVISRVPDNHDFHHLKIDIEGAGSLGAGGRRQVYI
jgi:hypothetical protein